MVKFPPQTPGRVARARDRALDLLRRMGKPCTIGTIGNYLAMRHDPSLSAALAELVAAGDVIRSTGPYFTTEGPTTLVYFTAATGRREARPPERARRGRGGAC